MVMLRLLPEQISRHWEVIKEVLKTLVTDGVQYTPEDITSITERLISGQVQCWAVQEKSGNGYELISFVFTAIITDAILNRKNLLLLGLYNVRPPSGLTVWKLALEKLRVFAKGSNCNHIVFYTDVPELVKIANIVGACTSFTYGILDT